VSSFERLECSLEQNTISSNFRHPLIIIIIIVIVVINQNGRTVLQRKIASTYAFRNYSVGSTETEDDTITLHILSNRRM
jgi:hypothetical protein